jgi:hypothetical protein
MSQTQNKYKLKVADEAAMKAKFKTLKPGTYTFIMPHGVKILTKCGKSNVEQHHRTEIKKMVADAESRGLLRASVKFEGQLDDFPDYDFQEAQMMMADARSKFEQLPSGIREKFENNPAKFMNFINKASDEQLKEYGFSKNVHDGITAEGTHTGKVAQRAAEETAKQQQEATEHQVQQQTPPA